MIYKGLAIKQKNYGGFYKYGNQEKTFTYGTSWSSIKGIKIYRNMKTLERNFCDGEKLDKNKYEVVNVELRIGE